MRQIAAAVMQLVGLALVIAAAARISPELGVMVAGLVLVVVGIALELRAR